MATQREVDAGLEVLNDMIEEYVTGLGSYMVKENFTEDMRFNLVLAILKAAEKVRKK